MTHNQGEEMGKNNIDILDKEVVLNDNDFIVSKTNSKGVITYCNEIFMKMAGYEESELLNKNHNIIRHPHMPKAAFKLCWDLISNGKEFFGFVKNLRKDGAYYWVFANITPDYDTAGNIIGYTSVRRKPSSNAIKSVIPIYAQMIDIERTKGIDASTAHLVNFLEQNNVSYDNLMLSLQGS